MQNRPHLPDNATSVTLSRKEGACRQNGDLIGRKTEKDFNKRAKPSDKPGAVNDVVLHSHAEDVSQSGLGDCGTSPNMSFTPLLYGLNTHLLLVVFYFRSSMSTTSPTRL